MRIRAFGTLVGPALLLAAQATNAQTSADTFDINRFSDAGAGWFETFHVDETQSLKSLRDVGILNDDMNVLVTETAGGPLALLTSQMAFHHIAQGTVEGQHWVATF